MIWEVLWLRLRLLRATGRARRSHRHRGRRAGHVRSDATASTACALLQLVHTLRQPGRLVLSSFERLFFLCKLLTDGELLEGRTRAHEPLLVPPAPQLPVRQLWHWMQRLQATPESAGWSL